MHDDSAENRRQDDTARTPVAADKGVAAINAPKLIDPERLSRAIRYIKEHPATRAEPSRAHHLVKLVAPALGVRSNFAHDSGDRRKHGARLG
jgi:hypothetical protein